MNLTDRVALVTGSGRGIGKAIALKLAALGATIVTNGVSQGGAETAREIQASGGRAIFIRADVSAVLEVKDLFEKISTEFGKIDILVNNAGITRDQLTLRMTDEEWDVVLNTNLKSVFLCTRSVLKYMMKQRWGRIINVSSITGLSGNPGQVNYSAAKAGIIGVTLSVAKEMASRQITVNAVAPGFIETDMTQKISQKNQEEIIRHIPAGYIGKPEDVAEAVAFFASEAAKYITGQVLCVDGGMVRAW
jgi:3-oxoacyl-[acyl-carrier protein] reductase